MKKHVNSAGIILATIGSLLVWKYLTELNFADKKVYLEGKGSMTIPCPTPEDVKKFKRTLLLSKLGLAMIVVGGALQVLSNYMCD